MPDKPIDPAEYEEEERPFEDVMRQLLAAKPKHKTAAKPKPKPKKPKKA